MPCSVQKGFWRLCVQVSVLLKGAEGFVAFFGGVLVLSCGIRAPLTSFAVVMKCEGEFKAWQESRLKRLRRTMSWARDRLTGGT